MKLIFVRHGHTYFNQIGLTQGWCDSPLSDKGKKQVNQLEKRLKDMHIDDIYSSVLGRAYQTASILNQNRHLNIHVDERLKEINFGNFEGLPEHVRDNFDVESQKWNQDLKMNYESYNGENILNVIKRHHDFMTYILSKHNTNDTLLIVGHGCSLYAFIKDILKDDLNKLYPNFQFFPNAGAVICQLENNQFQIIDVLDINKGEK